MMGDLGKLIVAKGFKKLPKVQKIARSGHTACTRYVAKICYRVITTFAKIEADSLEFKVNVLCLKYLLQLIGSIQQNYF